MRTQGIKYIDVEQFFNEVNQSLKDQGTYRPGLLYRVISGDVLPELKRTGNDRTASYDEETLKRGWKTYKGQMDLLFDDNLDGVIDGDITDIDTTAYQIMDEYGIRPEDFIFASTESEVEEQIYRPVGDRTLTDQLKDEEDAVMLVYDPADMKSLHTFGYQFKGNTKKERLNALVGVFKKK
jgi:hypothetical protein